MKFEWQALRTRAEGTTKTRQQDFIKTMKIFNIFKSKKPEPTLQVSNKNLNEADVDLCNEIIKGIPFGYKNSWFVFKNENFNLIREALSTELDYKSTVNFETGIREGWGGNFALLKPINGLTILISSNGFNFLKTAQKISINLGQIEFYATHRSNDFLMISRFDNGLISRQLQVSGDDGVIENIGEVTEIELMIAERTKREHIQRCSNDKKLEYIKSKEILSFLGDDEHLMEISENWSINPSKLNEFEVRNCAEIFDLKK